VWPVMTAGILSSALTVGGMILPYFELYKRQGQVIGISKSASQYPVVGFLTRPGFGFLAIDMLGAIFSLLALGAELSKDLVTY
jgi:hypothetical protein